MRKEKKVIFLKTSASQPSYISFYRVPKLRLTLAPSVALLNFTNMFADYPTSFSTPANVLDIYGVGTEEGVIEIEISCLKIQRTAR